MEQLKGPDAGTFMPRHVYDMNEKTEELHDFAYVLLPDSNDAKNTRAKLEKGISTTSTYYTMILGRTHVLKVILIMRK